MKFRCLACHVDFESEGTRKEYHDPIYGPCAKVIAPCPECGAECGEHRSPKPRKADSSNDFSCPSAPSGGCGCCPMN